MGKIKECSDVQRARLVRSDEFHSEVDAIFEWHRKLCDGRCDGSRAPKGAGLDRRIDPRRSK